MGGCGVRGGWCCFLKLLWMLWTSGTFSLLWWLWLLLRWRCQVGRKHRVYALGAQITNDPKAATRAINIFTRAMTEKYGRTSWCPTCGGRCGSRRPTERRERVEKWLMNDAMEAPAHGVSRLGHEVPPAPDQPQILARLEVHAGEAAPTAMTSWLRH